MIVSNIDLRNWRWYLLVFVIMLALVPIACDKPISKEKANQIAKEKLEEYCKNEGLSKNQFADPKVSSDQKHPWIYEYVSNRSPKHILLVYVDRYGKTEIHRMIE